MSRVLIINNGTLEPERLLAAFHDATVISYTDIRQTDISMYDLLVLSGSSTLPVYGNEESFAAEISLIRESSIPILGICLGFELIVVAYGGMLSRLPEKIQGVREVSIVEPDELFSGIEKLTVYEGHTWVAPSVAAPLIPLARSEYGIEAVRHQDRLMYGLQFHPEKHTEDTVGPVILNNLKALL